MWHSVPLLEPPLDQTGAAAAAFNACSDPNTWLRRHGVCVLANVTATTTAAATGAGGGHGREFLPLPEGYALGYAADSSTRYPLPAGFDGTGPQWVEHRLVGWLVGRLVGRYVGR